jgi:hypothetical protein
MIERPADKMGQAYGRRKIINRDSVSADYRCQVIYPSNKCTETMIAFFMGN